jgi:cytochrome P450
VFAQSFKDATVSRGVSPGPPAYPVLGHLPHFLRDRLGFLSRCARDYGEVVKLRIGSTTYLLTSPADIKHVLVLNAENYDKTPRLTSTMGKRLSGEGLMTHSGPTHVRQRRLLQPIFYKTAVQIHGDTVVQNTERMLETWPVDTPLDISSELITVARGNMIQSLFGMDYSDGDGRFVNALMTRRQYIQYWLTSPFPLEYLPVGRTREFRRARKSIDQSLLAAVRRSRAATVPSNDLLSRLVHARYEDGTGMTDEQICGEALTLATTGYETIGAALGWTCYLVCQHPEVEATLRAELDAVLNGRPPCGEDVPRLRYTWMVLSESMRLYPPTWMFVRVALADDRLPSGAEIPAGSKIFLSQYVMHRNPRYFPAPDVFDPARFSDAAKAGRPQFAYFPFGGGPRVCIGEGFAKMESVLVLACLLRRFRLKVVPGQVMEPEPGSNLRPKHGILMRLNAVNQEEHPV